MYQVSEGHDKYILQTYVNIVFILVSEWPDQYHVWLWSTGVASKLYTV